MQIPTKHVIVRATGHDCLINADDYNPEVHDLFAPDAGEPRKGAKAKADDEIVDDGQKTNGEGDEPKPKPRKGAKAKA